MFRTTIMLPTVLKGSLEKEAKSRNLSFGGLVREVLQKYLLLKSNSATIDIFFTGQTLFKDEGPTDGAKRHDHYLTQQSPHGKRR